MKRVRRSFPVEFKVEAVRRVPERGVSATQAARDLGIHINVLRNWVREHRSERASPKNRRRRPLNASSLERTHHAGSAAINSPIADPSNGAENRYPWP